MAAKKKSEKQPQTVTVSGLEWLGVESVPRFYSNNVQIRMSVWDVVFRFGEFSESQQGGYHVNEVARISMSPAHAKAFRILLDRYVDGHAILKSLQTQNSIMYRRFISIQMLDEGLDTPVEFELVLPAISLVQQINADTGV